MTDREIARYRKLRANLRMTATAALANARLYCSISDEQHEAERLALDAKLREHTRRVFEEYGL